MKKILFVVFTLVIIIGTFAFSAYLVDNIVSAHNENESSVSNIRKVVNEISYELVNKASEIKEDELDIEQIKFEYKETKFIMNNENGKIYFTAYLEDVLYDLSIDYGIIEGKPLLKNINNNIVQFTVVHILIILILIMVCSFMISELYLILIKNNKKKVEKSY